MPTTYILYIVAYCVICVKFWIVVKVFKKCNSHNSKIFLIILQRLKILTPRQTDINLDQLVDKFRERKRSHLDVEFRTKYEEEERRRQWQQEQRMLELQKAAQARQRQTELVARIK